MKNSILKFSLVALSTIVLFACKKDDETSPENPATTSGSFSLFLIDTNRVRTVNNDGTNAKLISQVAQSASKSVYISDLSANPERTKFAYILRKGDFPNYSTEVRVADYSGSNDKLVVALAQNDVFPGKIKFGTGGKIYYNYFAGSTTKFVVINEDGTGKTDKVAYRFADLTADGKFLLRIYPGIIDPSKTELQVLDLSGDGGAGSSKYNKTFALGIQHGAIASDGSKAVVVYKENNILKIQIATIAANTIEEKTIDSGMDLFRPSAISFTPDNKKLICTVNGGPTSKTYIYDLTAGTSTSFVNINKDVTNVYAF